jgi:hypothetical protein
MSALVLAGLPVTRILTSSAATLLSALPWAVKIRRWPRAGRRAPCPVLARHGADEQGEFAPSKTLFGSSPI